MIKFLHIVYYSLLLLILLSANCFAYDGFSYDTVRTYGEVSASISQSPVGVRPTCINLNYKFYGLGIGWTYGGETASPDKDEDIPPVDYTLKTFTGNYYFLTWQYWAQIDILPFDLAVYGEFGLAVGRDITLAYSNIDNVSYPFRIDVKNKMVSGLGISIYPNEWLSVGAGYNNINKWMITFGYRYFDHELVKN